MEKRKIDINSQINFRKRLQEYFTANKDEDEYVFDSNLHNYVQDFIIPNKKDLPLLYRYSPADYNNIRCLEEQKLYLSEAGRMNDIFEGLACKINDTVIKNLEELYDIAYLKSFSENKNDILMWSHYGDNFSGMCVEYDICEINNALAFHLFPVIYSNKRCIKSSLDISLKELSTLKYAIKNRDCPDEVDFLKDIMALFICKSKEWEKEAEWRLIVTYLQMHCDYDEVEDGNDTQKHYDINSQRINFPYAKAVYLGPKMKSHIKDHIAFICKTLKVEVFETSLSRNFYKLEATKYPYKGEENIYENN